MRTNSKVATIAITTGLVLVGAAGPAGAQPDTGETTVTFGIDSGFLRVSVPETSALGAVSSGADQISAQLGPVTVTDERAALNGSWSVYVTATDFSTGGGTSAETVPSSAVDYDAGAATATTGTGTFTTGGTQEGINVPSLAFEMEGGTGNNSATWNPTVTVGLGPSAVAGLYSGTVTHSFG
jgi:hypothetical protein